MGAPRHPTDAEREQAAREAVDGVLGALRRASAEAARRYLREDVVWLGGAGRGDGPDAAVTGLAGLAVPGREWAEPQRHGAHAVLRHSGAGPDGGLVIETRGGAIVLLVAAP